MPRGRTKQTARKSTGGMAPRKQLASMAARERWKASTSSADLDVDSLMRNTDLSSAAHRLPVIVNPLATQPEPGGVDPSSIICSMPKFDLGSISDGSYVLSRKPIKLKGSVSSHADEFLTRVLKRAAKKYKQSKWVMVWENADGSGYSVLPQEECEGGEYDELEQILKRGQLNGCDLRGNKDTNQYGLVSNKELPANTFVAVECGVIWSELIHDEVVEKQGDPLIGLSSNLIPAKFLRVLSDDRTWKSYRRECAKDGPPSAIPGFVVESSFRGNETKHIDDPGWLYMAADSAVESTSLQTTPNLEARVIFDLERPHSITVGFETTRDVASNTELTMNWGCWGKICDRMLPGHAQMSLIAHKCQKSLESIASTNGIALELREEQPGPTRDSGAAAVFFSPKETTFSCLERVDKGMGQYINIGSKLGQGYSLLNDIMKSDVSVGSLPSGSNWCKPFDYDSNIYKLFAKRSDNRERLSLPARRKLDNVPSEASTNFAAARKKIVDPCRDNVEVVEITDPSNPAKLFELPTRPALGLRAKRNIRKNSPVLAYGGVIEQLDEGTSRDGYAFDLTMPDEYEGPRLHIDGRQSIGGMINDPWTPTGFAKREANLVSIEHWDEETKTPQIVLYATRAIKKGDELLYHYGDAYWKVTWITLIREHAEYVAETAVKCRSFREQIFKHANAWSAGITRNGRLSLEEEIVKVIRNMECDESEEDDGEDEPPFRYGATGWLTEEEDGLGQRTLRSGQDY